MNEFKNILYLLKSLLQKKDRKALALLVLFSVIVSLVEVVGVSAIMPFLSLASDPDAIQNHSYYLSIYTFFHFKNHTNFVIVFAIILICYYLFRSVINIMYVYAINKFTQGQYHYLSHKLFSIYMNISYATFVKNNSAEMTKTIVTEANLLMGLIASFLSMFSEVIIMLFIYSIMLFVNWKITLILTIFLGMNAFLILMTVTKKIKFLGRERARMHSEFYELLNRSFGNFKVIKLSSSGQKIIDNFGTVSQGLSKIAIAHQTLNNIPRLFLEGMGFSIIVGLVAFLLWDNNGSIASVLPTISLFVLSLYRLLPSVNKIMSSLHTIHYSSYALELISREMLIETENLEDKSIVFEKMINLKNITFGHDIEKPIIKDLNLIIHKGNKIGFIGESGSGKSTLVDLIIGLYTPSNGDIYIDQQTLTDKNMKSWRSHIGYIPQSVYLFDGTVSDNVVFGREYNEDKIVAVLQKAKIYNFLLTKEGIETPVGEGGIILSGGQKQRIAIARALYGDPDILVLDEATSALDDITEKEIMAEIYDIAKDKTLLIIAHRVSTLDRCTLVYKIVNGNIMRVDNE